MFAEVPFSLSKVMTYGTFVTRMLCQFVIGSFELYDDTLDG
jgi:hypothetical protein